MVEYNAITHEIPLEDVEGVDRASLREYWTAYLAHALAAKMLKTFKVVETVNDEVGYIRYRATIRYEQREEST